MITVADRRSMSSSSFSLAADVDYCLEETAATLPATQVAEWAGHSVHVLLRVYAKCITGQDHTARIRIQGALQE